MQLVLDKYGAMLRVKDGRFYVRTEDQKQLIPMSKVKSIMLSRSTMVSAEAIAGAVEREIDLFFVERNGQPFARIWSNRYGSIATIRKNQLAFSRSAEAVSWVKKLLSHKLDNQCALLIGLGSPGGATEQLIESTVDKIKGFREKIRQLASQDLKAAAGSLRGWEGNASRLYFSCISEHLPETYRFDKRSKRPAMDMFNCLLNYSYGMLYNEVESALIRAGIDPYAGIFHRDEYNRPVLAYDVIERFRVWAEYPVIDLCLQQVVFPEFFDVEDGEYWLNAAGKRILIQSVNDYWEETVTIERKTRARRNHIRLYAESLANLFKNFNP